MSLYSKQLHFLSANNWRYCSVRAGVLGCALFGIGIFNAGCGPKNAATQPAVSLSQPAGYRAERLISIEAVAEAGAEPDAAMRSAYVTSQIALLTADKTVREAILDPRYQAVRPCLPTAQEISRFADNLSVNLRPRSETLVVVSYQESGPEAQRLAKAAVEALVAAYKKQAAVRQDQLTTSADKRKLYWKNEVDQLERKIAALRQTIAEDSKVTDGDPTALRKYEDALAAHQMDLQSMRRDYQLAQTIKKELENDKRKEPSAEEWGRVDPTMNKRLQMRDDLKRVVAALSAQLGPNHQVVLNRNEELAVVEAELASYARELSGKFLLIASPNGGTGRLVSRDLAAVQQSIEELQVQVVNEQARIETIRQAADRIIYMRKEIDQLNDRLIEAQQSAREWEFRSKSVFIASTMGDEASVEPIYPKK